MTELTVVLRWRRCPAALWRRSYDRVLVLPPGHDDILVLEGTGAAIWFLLEDPATLTELVEPLSELLDVTGHAVADQVQDFLVQLEAAGAVERG